MKSVDSYIFPINTIVCSLTLCAVIFTRAILGWKPCPMCLLQQLSVLCILVLSILGRIKKSPKAFSLAIQIITLIIILIAMYVAGDQIYLRFFNTFYTTLFLGSSHLVSG